MAKHWSEILECSCGMRFRGISAESVHRHNFPALCRKPKPRPGETLVWTRSQDGEYSGKPCYEYNAQSGDRKYCIVWACDHGGMFGYTARKGDEYMTERWGIIWARTLKACKAACEKLESRHVSVS